MSQALNHPQAGVAPPRVGPIQPEIWVASRVKPGRPSNGVWYVTKGSLGYLSSMYFSTSLVLGEVAGPFPEIESWE